MPKPPPVVYILHGEDDQAINEFLVTLRGKLGEPATADMNTQRLAFKGLTQPDLQAACLAIPFLAKRRLVIVDSLLSTLASRGGKKSDSESDLAAELESETAAAPASKQEWLSLFETIPPSTALVLAETRTLAPTNFGMKWAAAHPDLAYVREFAPPKGAELSAWVQKRAQAEGGSFAPRAAQMLAALVGEDPRTLAQEITKLLTFAGGRPVSTEDVAALTPESAQTNIFDMVDAIGGRDGQKAQRLLHKSVEQESAPAVFGMVVRQFRLLLQAREALDMGTPSSQLASAIGVHPFVAGKLATQARGFTLGALETIFRRLRDIDEGVKTGRIELETALQILVAELAG